MKNKNIIGASKGQQSETNLAQFLPESAVEYAVPHFHCAASVPPVHPTRGLFRQNSTG
jgi:hypothetical protein